MDRVNVENTRGRRVDRLKFGAHDVVCERAGANLHSPKKRDRRRIENKTRAVAAAVGWARDKTVACRRVQRVQDILDARDRVTVAGRIRFLQRENVDSLRVPLHGFVADGLENRAEVRIVRGIVRTVEGVPIDDPHHGEQIAAFELLKEQPPAGRKLPSGSRIAKLHASVPNASVVRRPTKISPAAASSRKHPFYHASANRPKNGGGVRYCRSKKRPAIESTMPRIRGKDAVSRKKKIPATAINAAPP